MYMFNEIDQDVTIVYPGGSGGFLLYFLLLLTENFISGDELILNSNNLLQSINDRISQQYPNSLMNNSKNWKVNEIWPNNFAIKYKSLNKRKLFLICNPLFEKNEFYKNLEISSNTFIILLYTNIHLHLRLAYDKNAYWFTDVSRKKFKAPEKDYEYITKIFKNTLLYQDKLVAQDVVSIIKIWKPNIIIDLNDLIKLEWNRNQQEFLKFWYKLQTAKIKNKLTWTI